MILEILTFSPGDLLDRLELLRPELLPVLEVLRRHLALGPQRCEVLLVVGLRLLRVEEQTLLLGRGPVPLGLGRKLAVAMFLRLLALFLTSAPVGDTTADRQNFGKMLLVFGCIGTDLCK